MKTVSIPTPDTVIKWNYDSPGSLALIKCIVDIVKMRFSGSSITVKLADILSNIDADTRNKISDPDDWDKMELAMKNAGWKLKFEHPGWDENWAAYYEISKGTLPKKIIRR